MIETTSRMPQRPDPLVTQDILKGVISSLEDQDALVAVLQEMQDLEPHLVMALNKMLAEAVARATIYAHGMSNRMLTALRHEQVMLACFIFSAMRTAWTQECVGSIDGGGRANGTRSK